MRKLFIIGLLLASMSGMAWGANQYVHADSTYTTFALGAAAVSAGDTLFVTDGSWECDNVTIPDGVVVQAVTARAAELDDSGAEGALLSLGTNVHINGLVLDGFYVFYHAASNAFFYNCDFHLSDASYSFASLGNGARITTRYCNYSDDAPDDYLFNVSNHTTNTVVMEFDTLTALTAYPNIAKAHTSDTDSLIWNGVYLDDVAGANNELFEYGTPNFAVIYIHDCYLSDWDMDGNSGHLLEGDALRIVLEDNTIVGTHHTAADNEWVLYGTDADLSSLVATGNTITGGSFIYVISSVTVDSARIYNNTHRQGLSFLSLQGDGASVTATYNDLDTLGSYCIAVGADDSTIEYNTVDCSADCTGVHPILLGNDGAADDDDTYANGAVARYNTVRYSPYFAFVFKNANGAEAIANTVTGETTLAIFKSATNCILANNEFTSTSDDGAYVGAIVLDCQYGTTDATYSGIIQDGNSILNNVIDGFSSSSIMYSMTAAIDNLSDGDTVAFSLNTYDNNVFIDYNTTIFADSSDGDGAMTSTEWLADANTNDDQSVFETSITTAQNNWQYWYGGAAVTNFVGETYNWYPIGTTVRTQFPRVSNTETGPYFLRLENADSLLSMYGATWAEEDIVVYPVYGGNQEKNAHRQYEIDRYLATGSDTLYVVPDNGTAVKVWK
jgi:hypothetical protein